MDDVKLINHGETKRTAPGHHGVRDSAIVTESEAAVYRERWSHLFEDGTMEVQDFDGNTLEAEYVDEIGRYRFEPSEGSDEDEQSESDDSGDEKGDDADGEDADSDSEGSDEDVEYEEEQYGELIEAIDAGEKDDELDTIIEHDSRSTVVDAAEDRKAEIE